MGAIAVIWKCDRCGAEFRQTKENSDPIEFEVWPGELKAYVPEPYSVWDKEVLCPTDYTIAEEKFRKENPNAVLMA